MTVGSLDDSKKIVGSPDGSNMVVGSLHGTRRSFRSLDVVKIPVGVIDYSNIGGIRVFY